MAEQQGNTIVDSELQTGSSSKTIEASRDVGTELNSVTPSISSTENTSSANKGRNYLKNQRKKLNRKSILSGKNLPSENEKGESRYSLRFQIRLQKGFFTNALKDELLRDLNTFLYKSSSDSLIPTFFGSGLRFGRVWFSPENQESHDWLKQKLLLINEKAIDDFRFVIEPFNLHQNSICLAIPWNANESLSQNDVLNRIVFQNPAILANYWKVNNVKPIDKSRRLFFCSISDDSLDLLKRQNFLVNYGFQKIVARGDMKK